MARTKLIAKYAPLDTPDLAERILQTITDHIAEKGIEDLPNLELNGRWTGKLSISDSGWRGDFDFLYPVLSMCRVDREGNVRPDMAKIEKRVAIWRDSLYSPHDDDPHIGVCDDTFDDSDFMDDDTHALHSASYKIEMDLFLNSGQPDISTSCSAQDATDRAPGAPDDSMPDIRRMFGNGFGIHRVESAEDYRKLMETIRAHAASGAGHAWINPDFDMDSIDEMFADDKNQEWLQWISDLRAHRFGPLPEDFDGLAEPKA